MYSTLDLSSLEPRLCPESRGVLILVYILVQGFHCSACSGRGLLDLPYPGYISDAGWVHTNVLCCPVQPPKASGAAPGPWGGRQQGTGLHVECNL